VADREALRDAERLLAEAEKLAGAIDREIAEMEAALRGAEESLARTQATARAAGDHVHWLGDQIDAGRELQSAVDAELAELAEVERQLRTGISAEAVQTPALATPGPGDGERAPLRVAAALPVFRRTTRTELDRVELRPALAHPEAWRRVAEDHPSLGDLLEAAEKQLEEATELADSRLAEAERFRREGVRRPATAPKTTEPSENR
jgi:hypothetical protein